MEPTDEALLEACRHNDTDAWELLIRRYQRLVYAIPRRAGLDEDGAAEVFQRVFTRLVQKLETIQQPDRLHAWLSTVARRETWRVIQQEKARAVSMPSDQEWHLVASESAPDDHITRIEQQHQIRRALDTLGERCVQLLTLLYYQHEAPSYTDIAAMLGTSVGSIGPTRARCLEKLKKRLDEMGFE